MRETFKDILTNLYNGNRGAAEEAAENISQVNTDNLSDEWERVRQERINYNLAMRKQFCESYCNF